MSGGFHMRSDEERISQLHKRVADLKRQRQKRIITVCTAACSIFCVSLIGLIAALGRPVTGNTETAYTGASIVNGSVVGGYVLVALIGFVLGVLLTVLIRKYQEVKGK